MNPAVEAAWWISEASRLQDERDEARRVLLALLVGIARNRDLLAFAHRELDSRFPEEKAA
jgi:hypothetical protein